MQIRQIDPSELRLAKASAPSETPAAQSAPPRFREGDFYGGINAGVDRMLRVIDGEPLPDAAKPVPHNAQVQPAKR